MTGRPAYLRLVVSGNGVWLRPRSGATLPCSGVEGTMRYSGDERSGPERNTPSLAAHHQALGEVTVTLREAGSQVATKQALLKQRDAVACRRAQLQARLWDLTAEYDDAALAVAEAASEAELGVPSLAFGAVQAHEDRCAAALADVQVRLASLDALYEGLKVHLKNLDNAASAA